MNIAIVDDEEKWRKLITDIVRIYTQPNDNIDVFKSGVEFVKKSEEYDVVLMDIDMPEMDGFETIMCYKAEHKESVVIILTTHLDGARKGYLVEAFRYVDKTKMEEELKEAFEKIREINRRSIISLTGDCKDNVKNISIKDILYVETYKRGSVLNTVDGSYKCEYKINVLEEKLEEYGFFRCHKSYLVNLHSAEHLDKEFVYFPGNKKAYISVRKYNETKRKYIAIKKRIASM